MTDLEDLKGRHRRFSTIPLRRVAQWWVSALHDKQPDEDRIPRCAIFCQAALLFCRRAVDARRSASTAEYIIVRTSIDLPCNCLGREMPADGMKTRLTWSLSRNELRGLLRCTHARVDYFAAEGLCSAGINHSCCREDWRLVLVIINGAIFWASW